MANENSIHNCQKNLTWVWIVHLLNGMQTAYNNKNAAKSEEKGSSLFAFTYFAPLMDSLIFDKKRVRC